MVNILVLPLKISKKEYLFQINSRINNVLDKKQNSITENLKNQGREVDQNCPRSSSKSFNISGEPLLQSFITNLSKLFNKQNNSNCTKKYKKFLWVPKRIESKIKSGTALYNKLKS